MKHAWALWIIGYLTYSEKNENDENEIKPIKLLRLINPNMLPQQIKNKFRNDIMPIMKLMSKAPQIVFDYDGRNCEDFINETFEIGLIYLKEKVEYIFKTNKWTSWSVSYFSKMIKYSEIMKHGTENDKKYARDNIKFQNFSRKRRR